MKRKEPPPPKTKEEFWKRLFVLFLFCCLSETSSPKSCKNTERQGFRWFFLILSDIKHHTKINQNKRTNQGDNLVIYHFVGLFLCWCVSRFCSLWFIFSSSLCFQCFSSFLLLCCFSSLVSFGYFAFCVFLFEAKEGK